MGDDVKFINKERMLARLMKVPEAVRVAIEAKLKTEVDDLVAAMKRAAPVSTDTKLSGERVPGQFRDSIHAFPNPGRPLSFRILADAKDEKGEFIGPHIEHGYMAPNGVHVSAKPSFFPTYRARKKGMQRRLGDAARKAVRSALEAK